MYKLKQIKFKKEDESSFLVPRLEKYIRKEEHQIKQENDQIIKIGCYISFFSQNMIVILSDYCFQSSKTTRVLFIVSQGLLQAFSCLLSGFFIDVISIRSSWLFLIITNIMFQMLHLTSVLAESLEISFIAKLSSQFLHSICIINFSCILYEAAPNFKQRLNNAVKLEVYGEYFPYIFSSFLQCLLKDFNETNEDYVQQIEKNILIYGILICQLLNLTSLTILNKTYKQIERIKIKSIQYQMFQIYQGVGLSFSKICKYMGNKNICFLLVISALCGCQNDSSYYFADEIFSSNTQNLIVNLFGLFGGLFVMKFVNSNKQLVQTCYKTITFSLYAHLLSTLFQVVVRAIQQDSIPSESRFILETVLSVIKECLYFIVYCSIHQIIIILLPNRCAMRAIGLSITFLPYFFFKMFCILSASNILWMRIAQIILTIITIFINYFYQKNISFNSIEKQLEKQYHY